MNPVTREAVKEALAHIEGHRSDAFTAELDESAKTVALACRESQAALAAEHENWLIVHRDNMGLATRNMELKKERDEARAEVERLKAECAMAYRVVESHKDREKNAVRIGCENITARERAEFQLVVERARWDRRKKLSDLRKRKLCSQTRKVNLLQSRLAHQGEVVEAAKKGARWLPHTGHGPEHAHIDCRRCEMDAALAKLGEKS